MSSLIPEATNLDRARTDDLKATAVAAVDAAPEEDKKDTVAAAAETLNPDQRLELAKELAESQWPRGDWAKATIYLAGFFTAGTVLCLSGFIAWKAQGGSGSIASDLIVAASSLVSLLIGGLVGAYVQR